MDANKNNILIIAGLFVVLAFALGAAWYFNSSGTVILSEDLPPAPADFDKLNIDEEAAGQMRSDTYEQGLKDFETIVELVKKNPDSVTNWVYLGSQKKLFGDFDGAEKAWGYALKLDEKAPVPRANLADLYRHFLKDYKKAEQEYLYLIENNPTASNYYRELSNMYRYSYLQKQDLADDVLLAGLEANPNSADLLSALAVYFYEEKRYEEAAPYYEQLLELRPDDAVAREDLENIRRILSNQ